MCTTSGVGKFVSAFLPSRPRYIRIDNLQTASLSGCKFINLAEITLWSSGVGVSMADVIPIMSTSVNVNSQYGSPKKFVDGNSETFIHTQGNPCDPNPWVYIDVGARSFDQVVVTNRVDCCSSRINGARVSFVGDINGMVPHAAYQYFPSTSEAIISFEFPEGSGALGGSAVSRCPDGYTTSSAGSTSAAACNVCATGYELVGTTCVRLACADGSYSVTGYGPCSSCPVGYSTFAQATIGASAAACNLCAAGYFGDVAVSGSSGCTVCPAGKATYFSGATQCDICWEGTYAPEGSSQCILCDAGKYSKKKSFCVLAMSCRIFLEERR